MWLKLILIELNKRRNAILGWGLGMAVYAAMILYIAPELAPQFGQLKLEDIAVYQAFGITESLDSAAAMVAVYVEFFGLFFAMYGIFTGVNSLAGEEEKGTLETSVAMPISRMALVLTKCAGIFLALLLIHLITFTGYLAIFPLVADELGNSLDMNGLFLSTLESMPMSLFFAMFGLMLGAYLPRRVQGLSISLALLFASYLFDNLGQSSETLEPLLPYQPFYYYGAGKVIKEGIDWNNAAVLLVTAVVCLGLALLAFQRRNITVAAWPWQRARLEKS